MEVLAKHRSLFRQSRSSSCKITICYLYFLHSAYLRQNHLSEGRSYPAKRVHPKNKTANGNKAMVGADSDVFADAELHLSFLR